MLRKIYEKYTFKYILNFNADEPNIESWNNFLTSLPLAKDDYTMSYNKYLCRMYYFPLHYKITMNFVSLFLLIILLVKIRFNNINKTMQDEEKKLLLIKSSNVSCEDIFPDELFDEFNEITEIDRIGLEKYSYNNQILDILKNIIKKHPLSYHYVFMIAKELFKISGLVDEYNPSAIVCYVNERNMASPLITSYLEKKNIEYISFMHGEYLLQLIQAYMKFSRYYVWDKHYIDMFNNDLLCKFDKIKVYTPAKYKNQYSTADPTYFCTYYFGGESDERIEKISKIFYILEDLGYKCKVRPHPRRSNYNKIHDSFKNIYIEDIRKVNLEKSLNNTEYVIGLNSTVLLEAYYGGKKVVIDDISEPERYKNLSKRKYIMLQKEHILLSSLLKELVNDEKN